MEDLLPHMVDEAIAATATFTVTATVLFLHLADQLIDRAFGGNRTQQFPSYQEGVIPLYHEGKQVTPWRVELQLCD